MNEIKIIECPRDAMQGIKPFIPTERKVKYIQSLLRVGFDTIDFGSFVSPKAIPQMQDTVEVLAQLDLSATNSKLLAIIANTQGAQNASLHKEIQYLGFPFSISENFQMRNTHKTIAESIVTPYAINLNSFLDSPPDFGFTVTNNSKSQKLPASFVAGVNLKSDSSIDIFI